MRATGYLRATILEMRSMTTWLSRFRTMNLGNGSGCRPGFQPAAVNVATDAVGAIQICGSTADMVNVAASAFGPTDGFASWVATPIWENVVRGPTDVCGSDAAVVNVAVPAPEAIATVA